MKKKQLITLILLVLLIVAIIILPLGSAIYFSAHISWHDRKGQAESIVNTSYYIVDNEYKQVIAGIKSVDQAKKDALATISKIKFGYDDYVWVVDKNATMLVHPDEKLVGKSIENFTDFTGTRVYDLMKDTTKDVGFGFMDYWWVKPAHMNGDPHRKVSYIRTANAWGWLIGAGIYEEDILYIVWQSKFRYFILMNISAGLLICCLFGYSRLLVHNTCVRQHNKEMNSGTPQSCEKGPEQCQQQTLTNQ